jgi:hypothetical protein
LFGRINPTGIALPVPFKEGANPEACEVLFEEKYERIGGGKCDKQKHGVQVRSYKKRVITVIFFNLKGG